MKPVAQLEVNLSRLREVRPTERIAVV